MAFTYDCEFVFIGRGDESFLENYSYELSEDPDDRGGKIFMALEILNNQAEAEDIGEAIFANFKQKFYEDLETDPYERFEEALKGVNAIIDTLKEEKVSRFIGNLNVAIGAVVGDTLYISVTGDSEVYLLRKKFTSVISEGLAEEAKKTAFINIANGTLEPFDRVLFSSTRLLRYVTKGELGRIFSNPGVPKIASELAELQDFIMTEILGRSSVIGISVAPPATEEEPAAIEETKEKLWLTFFKKWIPLRQIGWIEKIPWLQKLREKKIPAIRFAPKMKRERILISVVILLIVLVFGVFWIRTRGTQRRVIQEQQAVLNHVKDLKNDALTIGQFDKPKAAELLTAAEKEALQVLNSRFLRGEAVKALDDIAKQRDSLDDVKRIANPNVLADLSEKRKTVSALGLISLKDRLYAFEYNALYEIVLDKLQDPITISDLETVILGAAMPEPNLALFLTRTGKMIEYASARFSSASTKDGIWKRGIDMKTYNERVYILDPERNQIWRYERRRDGFDAGVAYNQNADLKKAVSLAIDASVYALNSDGTVIQLYQGQKQDYPLRRAPLSPLTSPTKIYTASELNHLFILEPGKQRVLLFKKDSKNPGAQYQTQYVFEKTGLLRDLLIADGRLYVMDDKKVYFINLSGL